MRNIDQCRITDGPFFEGVSLRLFDLADGLWRIYWIDSTSARLFLPSLAVLTDPTECFEGKTATTANPFW